LHGAGLEAEAKEIFSKTYKTATEFNVSGHIRKLLRYGYRTEAEKPYRQTKYKAKTFDSQDIETLHTMDFDEQAHDLFTVTVRKAKFNVHDIIRLFEMVGFRTESEKLYEETVTKLNSFDDTTVNAIVILRKAGLFESAADVYSKTEYYIHRWDIDHITQLKLANMRKEARDLYGKTKQWAGHEDPFPIIEKLKAVGLDEDADDFRGIAMARNQKRNNALNA